MREAMLPPAQPKNNSEIDQRVTNLELREGEKIEIRRPKFPHPVMQTKRRNPRIVSAGTGHV